MNFYHSCCDLFNIYISLFSSWKIIKKKKWKSTYAWDAYNYKLIVVVKYILKISSMFKM